MSNFFSRLVSRAADRSADRSTDRGAQIRPNIAPRYAAEGQPSDGAPAILEQEVEVSRSGSAVSTRSALRTAAAPRTERLTAPAAPGPAAPVAPVTQPGAAAPPAPALPTAKVATDAAQVQAATPLVPAVEASPESLPTAPAAMRSARSIPGQAQAAQPQRAVAGAQLAGVFNQKFSPALQATLGRLAKHLGEDGPQPPALEAEAEAEAKPEAAQVESAMQLRAALPVQAPAAASQRTAVQSTEAQAPVYRIHIGRIEVRAAAPTQPVKQPARAPVQGTTLAEYQKQIRGRRP